MSLKSRLAAQDALLGCFLSIPHPVAVEVCARQRPDLVCIDAEHAMIDRSGIEMLVRCCDTGGVPALVRVPSSSGEWIGSAIDAGAEAILVPRVSSAEEAWAIASAARLPPLGQRGAGPGRASTYGADIGAYIASSNDRVLVAVQIETADGLENVDAIAATDGIDMLFVGPFDLALSIGAAGEAGLARLDAAIERIAAAGRAAGKALGIFRPTTADIPRWRAEGFGLFLVGSDALFMGQGLAAMKASARFEEAGE